MRLEDCNTTPDRQKAKRPWVSRRSASQTQFVFEQGRISGPRPEKGGPPGLSDTFNGERVSFTAAAFSWRL